MKIKQLYTKCLSQSSYYIEDNNEVAIIDPLRDVEDYIKLAKVNGAKIKYIFETHFHADFVSGHKELAERTGAKIIIGPVDQPPKFDTYIAKDGDIFTLGNDCIQILHTPGHTLESICLLAYENNKPKAVFTGDTLFIGSAGRPDLAQGGNTSIETLAKMLYKSIRDKIAPLDDDVIIYPAHGAGSLCGSSISNETFDTIGHQKKSNFALDPNTTQADFVKIMLENVPFTPEYFAYNVSLNKSGANSLEDIVKAFKSLSIEDIKTYRQTPKPVILDTRSPKAFLDAHIKGSVFIGLDGAFAPTVGRLIKETQDLIIVAPEGRTNEVAIRLSRVGYDKTLGYIDLSKLDEFESQTFESITAKSFINDIHNTSKHPTILDVRNLSEIESSKYLLDHVVHLTLHDIPTKYKQLECYKGETIYVYCAGGYRSVVAISLLFRLLPDINYVNISDGYTGIARYLNQKESSTA